MKEYIVAIELGSSKIVGIAGYRDESGNLVVVAIEKENAVNFIKRGCVQNIEEVYSCIKKLKAKLENRLAPAKIVRSYVGVAGLSVYADEKVVRRSFHEDSIITQTHIQKLTDECRSLVPSTVDVLDVVPVGYVIDGRAERNPKGMTGTNIEARYKVITSKPVLKRNIDRCILDRFKLPIAGYIPQALATANVVLSKEERTLGCMLIDFGAETTTVSIYKNDALVSLETLPMGGRNITRDIASLNLIGNEAEHLKIASGMATGFKSENNVRLRFEGDNMVEIDLAKLSSVVEARSEEIIANVEEQIKRSGLERKELTAGVVVVGAAAKLRGWMELLQGRFGGIKVRMGVLRKDIQVVEKERSQVNDYLQAVGLLYAAKEVCTKTIQPVVISDDPEDPEDPDVDKQKVVVKPQKGLVKVGIFRRLRDKFGKFVEEGETEAEKNED